MKNKKIALLAITAMAALTACSGGGGSSAGSLNIGFVKLGYGDAFMTELVKGFKAKTGIKVSIDERIGSDGVSALDTDLESHASKNDLFFNKRYTFPRNCYKQEGFTVKGTRYNCLFEDITDVWDSKADESENVTIREKMFDYLETYYSFDDHFYGMPWTSGFMGIVRNRTVWSEKLGLTDADMPYTTDEMFALCDKIVEKNVKTTAGTISPFIYCFGDEYYSCFINIWTAQYEGKNVAENYYMKGKDPDGNSCSEYFFTYDGMKEALEVTSKLLNPDNNYQNPNDSLTFTAVQRWFLTGEALFMVNGSWLENEAGNNSAYNDTDFIKTPVISALSKKLSYYDADDEAGNDEKLSAIVKYVDACDAGENAVKPEYATTEDVETVTEARHYSYISGGSDHQAYIPSYAKNKDNAKAFLRYMYSDEGLAIYRKCLNGIPLPADPTVPYEELENTPSTFMSSFISIMDERYFFDNFPKAKFFSLGGVGIYYTNGCDGLCKSIKNQGLSASTILSKNTAYLKEHITEISDNMK